MCGHLTCKSFATSPAAVSSAPSSSASSSSSPATPPAPVVLSESVLRPAPSTSFPVGEKFYGLENANNVCYTNSVLQALYACQPFRQQLLVYYEDHNKKRKPDDTLLLSLSTLFYRIQTSKKGRGVLSPAAFVKKLKKSNEQFDSTAHQDAQEFLIFLLNDISDTIKAEKEKAVRDKLAAQQVQAGGGGGVGGGGVRGGGVLQTAKKSGFSSLFSSPSSSAPSSPAPSHHSLVSSAASSSPATASSSTASTASTASHTSSHSSSHHAAADGSVQLQNMSAVSAATAAGSKPANSAVEAHEPSTTASTSSSPSTTSTISASSAATTGPSLPSHSSASTSAASASSTQSSVSSSSSSSTSTTAPNAASTSSASGSPSMSWVQSLFEGTLTNLTSCLRCGSVSERDESFLDLSVDLLEHHSLSSCLRSFSHDEMLSGNDKYLCDACGCRQEAVKSLRIKSTPAILILHMKRFKYQEAIRTFAKLTYRVTFPLSLRLPNTSGDCGLYSLTAVVVHIGNGARSGHYVCMCRGSSGHFYLYDDTTITAIGESELQATFGSEMGGSHQDGYLLFYSQEQLSTRPALMCTKAQQASSTPAVPVMAVNGESAVEGVVDTGTGQASSEMQAGSASGISVAG